MTIFLLLLAFLVVAFFVTIYICYLLTFAVKKKYTVDPFIGPNGQPYNDLSNAARTLIEDAIKIPFEDVYITTKDGLTLHGRFYEVNKNAPTQILFHGYKSVALRDFSGGMPLALECGCNALLVDQRAHGKSDGNDLSFGIKERYDCLEWINYVVNRLGDTSKIILTGISMGAATVLMSSELPLPQNVVGIIADSGYSSPKEIIIKVIKDIKLPTFPTYFFIRLSGKIYGGFDIEECSCVKALRKSKIPVLFIHGEADLFVPCDMSIKNYSACNSKKQILTVPSADHGLSYLTDNKKYCDTVKEFILSVI